jgi:hypothetical protein
MDLETKFKKETGFDAYAHNDLRPKVPSDYYVEWLEEQLTLTDVGNCPFEAYAVFCIECDRKGLKPIKYKDYLNLG